MTAGRTLAQAAASRTAEVVAALGSLDDEGLAAPSDLPGWSRLTVACHLRYGARTLRAMTADALAGRPASYYPGGRADQRPGTLAPEDGERPGAVVESLAAAGAALDAAWDAVAGDRWNTEVHEPPGNPDLGTVPLVHLALSRLTEVEVHGTDLALGLPDWSATFVAAALPHRVARLRTRRTNHRPVDDAVSGCWLLVASDGPAHRVAVRRGVVETGPADAGDAADAVITGSSRDLLALLLGRPTRVPLELAGDAGLAGAFGRAFPGP